MFVQEFCHVTSLKSLASSLQNLFPYAMVLNAKKGLSARGSNVPTLQGIFYYFLKISAEVVTNIPK
jgi:hypothetical protein